MVRGRRSYCEEEEGAKAERKGLEEQKQRGREAPGTAGELGGVWRLEGERSCCEVGGGGCRKVLYRVCGDGEEGGRRLSESELI